MPANAEERVANAIALIEAAVARAIPADHLFVDPLVLPVAVAPEAPVHVLEAARELRKEYGDTIHLVGGLSNVSFGMPERRLLNDTFIDLAAEAGIDLTVFGNNNIRVPSHLPPLEVHRRYNEFAVDPFRAEQQLEIAAQVPRRGRRRRR